MTIFTAKKTYFITGTGTAVGKTVVTAALAYYFKNKSLTVGVAKSIQCGLPADIDFIKEKAVLSTKEVFCPLQLVQPLSPQIAAAVAHLPHIDTHKLIRELKVFSQNFDITLIEGAGGLYVPIKPGYMMIDLIKELHLPVIIVSRINLGTINHTMLTIEALKQKNIEIKGIVYDTPEAIEDLSSKLNPITIEEISGIKTLAILPHQNNFDMAVLAAKINI